MTTSGVMRNPHCYNMQWRGCTSLEMTYTVNDVMNPISTQQPTTTNVDRWVGFGLTNQTNDNEDEQRHETTQALCAANDGRLR